MAYDIPGGEPLFVQPQPYGDLLSLVEQTHVPGVWLQGAAGTGKTTLLRRAEREFADRGSPTLLISAAELEQPEELGEYMLDLIQQSGQSNLLAEGTIARSSAGRAPVDHAAEYLKTIGSKERPAVLLVDGLDQSPFPDRLARSLGELSDQLENWTLIVSSQTGRELDRHIWRSRDFSVLHTQPLGPVQGHDLLGIQAPTASQSLDAVLDSAMEPLVPLLIQLAITQEPVHISSLAASTRTPEADVRMQLDHSVFAQHAPAPDTYTVADAVRDRILSKRVLAPPFTLSKLTFGNEAAEEDDRLDASFVPRPMLEEVRESCTIVIGDRGAGKSAIYRKLSEDEAWGGHVDVIKRSDLADLLQQLVAADTALTVERCRAVWLVALSSLVASEIGDDAPKALRRTASDLRAAFGTGEGHSVPLIKRLLGPVGRAMAGSSLTFAVGPINVVGRLPAEGEKLGKKTIDVPGFLKACDDHLVATGRQMKIMLDRVDEMFKYERPQQEQLVQALFQMEAYVTQFQRIGVIVFVRTDLFELYDIQEKNKLVSRSLTLEWSEDDWLRVLVNRVFTNPSLEHLAQAVRDEHGAIDLGRAFEVLFPADIEGQPVERWLMDSVRNGNGKVSPRLAVLLLLKIRNRSINRDAVVTSLPLFSGQALQSAMTELSTLSFSEVTDDFKVAKTFVLSCRAGKLQDFTLPDVEHLFGEADGPMNEQVLMLERLGFLERVVLRDQPGGSTIYRIPKLYTRCWDHK